MSDTNSTPVRLTDHQKLATFCGDYGIPKIILRAHEVLDDYFVDGMGRAVVVLTRYRVVETKTRTQRVAKGSHIRIWMRVGKSWYEEPPMLTWDEDFQPETVARWDVMSPAERIEKDRYEAQCAKPGTASNPMHSFSRVAQSAPELTTDKMARHWGLTSNHRTEA